MLKEMQTDKRKFIPKAGFNVVAVDDFEDPGEQLYLVGYASTQADAEVRKKQFQKDNPGEPVFIYGPDTR